MILRKCHLMNYRMLKTHDLELQQRKNRKSSKAKQVALKVDSKPAVVKEKNSGYGRRKGKEVIETDESNTDDELNHDDDSNTYDSSDDDMIQMVAMIVKGFKKLKYRK